VTGTSPGTRGTDRAVERARRPSPVARVRGRFDAFGRGVRNLVVEARSGQRPLVVVLLVAIGLSVVMLSGPAERYLDGRSRVEALRTTGDALDEEIAVLQGQTERLADPRRLEDLAREQQGMVRPGEIPYTLVPPETDRPRITAPRDGPGEPTPPWYARAWDTVSGWF
jgi:cell division protein FtsB